MPEVGDGDGASYHEGNIECIVEFLSGYSQVSTLNNVVGYTIVAAENGGSHQSKQFLSLFRQGTFPVGCSIQVEKAGDPLVVGAQDSLVHFPSVCLEIINCRHSSSRDETLKNSSSILPDGILCKPLYEHSLEPEECRSELFSSI